MNFTSGNNFLFQFITVLYTIILQITNSTVHLMFPDSLWIIINVLYICVSAPISPGTVTYQVTLSHFHPDVRRSTIELSVYCILQEPVMTFSKLKQVSISETLLEYGGNLIKLNSICILTYFEVYVYPPCPKDTKNTNF